MTLPDAVERLIREVVEASGLGFDQGRPEVERELRAHFEDGLDSGLSVDEVIERFGDPVEAGRKIRVARPRAEKRNRGTTGRWWMGVGEWVTELKRAVRRLRRAPGFTFIVVATLALGVGVNAAIFTVLNAVLLEDLPYAEPDRLVHVYEDFREFGASYDFLRAPVLAEIRNWDEVFVAVAAVDAYREQGADLTDGDVPTRVTMLPVSAGYFETLGRPPLLGRTFLPDESYGAGEISESTDDTPRVTVLSHALWVARYDEDPAVLGQRIELDGVSYQVVGVMPPSFRDPIGSQADLWVPQDMRLGDRNHFTNWYLSGIARLRDGVSIEAAHARLEVLSRGYEEAQPEVDGGVTTLRPLKADLVGETRQTMLWILAAAAALVLLTACVNVANLLFARGLGQDRTLALQAALGSGRGRLVAGILVENGLLAAMGGVAGLGLGWFGLRALTRIAPNALPGVTDVGFGTPVFLFALTVTAGALLVFGLTPALRMSRTAPADVLRSGDRASTSSRFVRRLRDGLVIVQVAAALVLVTGAALLTRSFSALLSVPLGVEAEQVVTFEVHLPLARYPTPEERVDALDRFQERVAALPDVEAVGAVSWLPANGRYHSWSFYWDPDNPDRSNNEAWYGADMRTFQGDYLEAMGIEVVRGQSPADVDLLSEPVIWLNEVVAETVLEGVDPLDQVVFASGADRRVAGIVRDVAHTTRGDVAPTMYVAHSQADSRNWALIQTVKARTGASGVQDAIRAELRAIDPNLVLFRPQTFPAVLDRARAQDRFATFLMMAFGVLALVLSLVGTYGVLAGTVASRTREIGIRMALGASRESVRSMVLRYAAGLTVPGVLLGLVGAWVASRWIGSLLYGVGATDLGAWLAAVSVFIAVGAIAGWVPAVRATRVDTVEVLSAE